MDPLDLGQRVVAVFETGLRTATYKLATLMALTDHCVANLPTDPAGELEVPIADLAHRVMELYWRQVVPLTGYGRLKQSTQSRERIPAAVLKLRERTLAVGLASLDLSQERLPAAYREAADEVGLTLVQQPLHRLQRLPGGHPGEAFLYDDSWMHDQVSRRTIERRGAKVTLYPGVASSLARLSGLLRPTLGILWVEDVARLNRASLGEDRIDLSGHLFGQDRVGLGKVREAYFGEFGASCFYCAQALHASSPIDHLLPWSRVGLDGLANLVPACGKCILSKSGALPAPHHVTRALARDPAILASIGSMISWPVQRERTVSAAKGLYAASPAGTPLWDSRGRFAALDLTVVNAPWMSVEYRHQACGS